MGSEPELHGATQADPDRYSRRSPPVAALIHYLELQLIFARWHSARQRLSDGEARAIGRPEQVSDIQREGDPCATFEPHWPCRNGKRRCRYFCPMPWLERNAGLLAGERQVRPGADRQRLCAEVLDRDVDVS